MGSGRQSPEVGQEVIGLLDRLRRIEGVVADRKAERKAALKRLKELGVDESELDKVLEESKARLEETRLKIEKLTKRLRRELDRVEGAVSTR
jgi:hypothetical protein